MVYSYAGIGFLIGPAGSLSAASRQQMVFDRRMRFDLNVRAMWRHVIARTPPTAGDEAISLF
jgi:hypothetical protein